MHDLLVGLLAILGWESYKFFKEWITMPFFWECKEKGCTISVSCSDRIGLEMLKNDHNQKFHPTN